MQATPISDLKELISIEAWLWLSYKGSLTEKLKKFTNNKITFHVVTEKWGEHNGKKAWLRNIQWIMNEKLWINANLIVPETSINNKTNCLLDTHDKPIGNILFNEPSLERSDFQFFKLHDNTTSWIRESIFIFRNQPIILTETFYPDFFEAIKC